MPMYRMKKGMTGEAVKYISRAKAIKKLQINLFNFNRLCIIKGIYPIEPKNRIKAQGGNSKFKPLYLKKDIKFLLHDPLIWTMRDEDSSLKKLKSAKHLRNMTKLATIKRNKPVYRLDQNVLERYPSFLDAIKDLSDPLTMVFLFAQLGALKPVQEHHVTRCHRLRTEFLTYVIEARCLTKAFISTRGYYYEVEILGRRVVWTAPHNCVTTVPINADLKIMKHFLEFYIAMLGFVNFRLLSKVNLRYPMMPANAPQYKGAEKKDLDNYKNLMASLNIPMLKTEEAQRQISEVEPEDDADVNETTAKLLSGTTEMSRKAYTVTLENEQRRKVFEGLKFFIGIETNRESLTFVIRSCGGQVSWPSSMFPCSSYTEDDQCITHQIIDRPSFEKNHLSRYYVQPQYVYDCVNAATLLSCQSYLPGGDLPPHVCPFLKNYDGWYVPPEEETLRKLIAATPEEKEEILRTLAVEQQEKQAMMRQAAADVESSDEDSDADNDLLMDEDDDDKTEKELDGETGMEVAAEETAAPQPITEKESVHKKPEVRRGKEMIINKHIEKKKEEKNEHKMRAMMVHKKNRNLYHKLQAKEKNLANRSSYLKERREAIEDQKMGKISQKELDYPAKKAKELTFSEKLKEKRRKRVKEAVKFSKSPANKYRTKN